MTTNVLKHTCDRCGNSIEKDILSIKWYPMDWQHITLGQTGATLDLCDTCNNDLLDFLAEKGAIDMCKATHNMREPL